jgi:hypothetical protein
MPRLVVALHLVALPPPRVSSPHATTSHDALAGCCLPLIMPPSCLHEEGMINNAKALLSTLTPPLLSHEQGTTNNAEALSSALLPPPSSSHKQEKINNAKA